MKKNTFTLGYSPCPNDTFIFDALIHQKIDTEGLQFDVLLGDVEDLNRRAFRAELDITKLSYHAFAHLTEPYALLHSGSALGNNCGPLLIAKKELSPSKTHKVAIPGKYTTANFLLGITYPALSQKSEVLFSDIETVVLNGQFDMGLLIHENRFTYSERGLVCIADLGERWETRTKLPIPLGGIVVRRSLPHETQARINRVLRRSVEFALANPAQTLAYVATHAQAMSREVMMQHINLYVNHYTIDLGEQGRAAVERLFAEAWALNVIPQSGNAIFS
ncbi:MAG: hypothetical protein RI894_1328 [Bacteroidota bacterium]